MQSNVLMGLSTRTPDRTVTRCLVCGSTEVRTDEVVDRGVVFLAECVHCDHRWTAPMPQSAAASVWRAVRPARPLQRVGREVSTAA